MSGKRYILISTCGFYSAEKNYESVKSMFDYICGKGNYETISAVRENCFVLRN